MCIWHARCLNKRRGELKMKVAVPIWQERVSPVFDVAKSLLILDAKNGRKASRTELFIGNLPSDGRAKRLVDFDVDVLLCGAISRPLANEIMASGIEVVSWLTGPVEELLDRYITRRPLEGQFLMPGCRACRHRLRGPRRREHDRHQRHYGEDMGKR